MREFYSAVGIYPTSDNGNIALVRSHVAYHCGNQKAERAVIKPSRGYTMRVNLYGKFDKASDIILTIVDEYDHRSGIKGLI